MATSSSDISVTLSVKGDPCWENIGYFQGETPLYSVLWILLSQTEWLLSHDNCVTAAMRNKHGV